MFPFPTTSQIKSRSLLLRTFGNTILSRPVRRCFGKMRLATFPIGIVTSCSRTGLSSFYALSMATSGTLMSFLEYIGFMAADCGRGLTRFKSWKRALRFMK